MMYERYVFALWAKETNERKWTKKKSNYNNNNNTNNKQRNIQHNSFA